MDPLIVLAIGLVLMAIAASIVAAAAQGLNVPPRVVAALQAIVLG